VSDLLKKVAGLQVEALAGLADLSDINTLRAVLAEMGFDVPVIDEAHTAIKDVVALFSGVEGLADQIIFGRPTPEEIPGLVTEVAALVDSIRTFEPPSFNGLPAPFDQQAFWTELAEDLAGYMLLKVLRRKAPIVDLILFSTGVVKLHSYDGTGFRSMTTVEKLDFTVISDFVADPAGTLSDRFGLASMFWQNDTGKALFARLASLDLPVQKGRLSQKDVDSVSNMALTAGQYRYDIFLQRGAAPGTNARRTAGIRMVPDPTNTALGIGLFVEGDLAATSIPLTQDWDIALSIASDSFVQLIIDETGATPEAPNFEASARLVNSQSNPLMLFGEPEATRLELENFDLGLSLIAGAGTPEVKFDMALEGLTLYVVPGDNFLSNLMGSGFDASVDFDLAWSSRSGVTVGGSVGLSVTLPMSLVLGPITLTDITIAVEPTLEAGTTEPNGVELVASTGVLAELGPFVVEISDMGLRLSLEDIEGQSGLVGPYSLAAGAKPPSRLSFAIMTEAVQGGGVISIDDTRYSGALMIKVVNVGISALPVVDTVLPGDPDGWSFFAALSLEFPAIPLGFGFTLSGLGGLIALNRGFDENALALGLKDGAVDSLLFPSDPINDAAIIISQIDDYFPPLAGNTVIGPMVQIGWGTPKTLMTAEIGVMVSLPEGKIGVIGTIAILLPDPAAPLLSLNLDVLGVIDVPGGTFLLAASLYDSQLLQTIELSGDMGAFLSTRNAPYFLLSVGGYNPGFQPPSIIPAALHDLRRMRASINVGTTVTVSIESYFALTSNTVQFGSEVYLEASVRIWPVTYFARGELGFHIMLRFSPFKILADFEASVGIYAGNKELMGVHLAAHLEGPEPWFVSGFASFRFFGVNVEFEVEVGSKAAPESKPLIPLRDDVLAALRSPKAWEDAGPANGLVTEITYVDLSEDQQADDRLWIRADHSVMAKQNAAPLNKTIEIVGQALPTPGHERMSVTRVELGNTEITNYDTTVDWFPPAHFEALGKTEKLSRASFEEMTAGVSFGSTDVVMPDNPDSLGREITVDYEEDLFEGAPQASFKRNSGSLDRSVAAGSAGFSQRHVTAQPTTTVLSLTMPQFTVVSAEDGAIAEDLLLTMDLPSGGMNQFEALTAATALTQSLEITGTFVVVPVSAALEDAA
jgi:hypothetical protein